MDLGYVVFASGDHFFEHYYSARWYNIFEVRSAEGVLKGWYCNITRPACFEGDMVTSEDLELDLFVAPDRKQLLRLDLDEFAALELHMREPKAYDAAIQALHELEEMARTGAPPSTGNERWSGRAAASRCSRSQPLYLLIQRLWNGNPRVGVCCRAA